MKKIEKLPDDRDFPPRKKLNEVIDAVNELQERVEANTPPNE